TQSRAVSTLDSAEEALRLAPSEPLRSRALALEVLRQCPGATTAVVAERALGMAAKARHDWAEAKQHLERSISLAISGALPPVVAAEIRASLAPVLWYLGDTAGALAQVDLAAPELSGAVAARLEMNRAFIIQREGRLDEALEIYRRTLATMRRLGDTVDEASLLTNRAILHAYRGELTAAEADLLLAERLHAQLGQKLQAADVRHNLGFIAARRGDIPTALLRYDQAERERAALGVSAPQALLDRCDALLAVRLVSEARRVGEVAATRLAAAGLDPELAEVRLLLAQAALLAGDVAEARRVAHLARQSFERQHRSGWMALADYAVLRADYLDQRLAAGPMRDQARRTGAALARAGWSAQALDARIIAAQAALSGGAVEEAVEDLRESAAALRWGPADLRGRAWLAQALLRNALGNRRGTQAALVAGMKAVTGSRASLGATELRVHAAAHGLDIATFGLRLAVGSGRAARVLAWTERCRSTTALRMRPPRPPSDEEIASCLTRLRHVVSQVEEAALSGSDTKRLLRQQALLEAELRQRTRHAKGGTTHDEKPPGIPTLRAALEGAVLVEMVELDDHLYAVTLNRRRTRLHALGPTAPVAARTATLRFALGRLANRRSSAASADAALQLARETALELDRLLLWPLHREIGDEPLVLVPIGVLHAIPWITLPSCRGRAVTVCPSAGLWLGGKTRVRGSERRQPAVLVAGPGLAHAPAEIRDLSRVYPCAEKLVGPEATSSRFARAAANAALVHVAAHGNFRDDNPLLSSLRLADGPMTVYDLEALSQPPTCLVLSACDAGLSAVRPGEELMGLSAALLGSGSTALVASVTAARDVTARSLMLRFHQRLNGGMSPAHALAEAQETLPADDPADAFAAGGFVCFGAGLEPV
ncbi:MAG: CHAT domain-containing protein, partial [Actinomycetota bacterium]|nr:CHAT domain-containing protein [Actinomycetota bacterium]